MTRTSSRALRGLVTLAVACRLAVGHPQYWDGCGHPDRDYLGGHQRVQPSSDIVFALLEGGSRGTPVTAYEPGVEYTLRIVPPRRSEGMLTATIGDLDGMGADTSSNWIGKCNNGRGDLRLNFDKRRSVFYAEWRAPIEVPQSNRPVEFRATFGYAEDSDLAYAIATIPPVPRSGDQETHEDPSSRYGRCWQTEDGEVCETLCAKASVEYEPGTGGMQVNCVFPVDK